MTGAVPRYRAYSGVALFAHGFRPFFLGAGVWAVVALALWVAAFFGVVTIPTVLDPLSWHAHEMLFGFIAATIGGFVLTAVPNWTKSSLVASPMLSNRKYHFAM